MASEYAQIVRAWGPTSATTADGLLAMLDEPADSTGFRCTLRSSGMVAAGWGSAATDYEGTPTTVAGSLTTGLPSLLDGGPTCARFTADTATPYKGSYIDFGDQAVWRSAIDYDKNFSCACVCKPVAADPVTTRESLILAKMAQSGGQNNGFKWGVRTANGGSTHTPFVQMSTPLGASTVYAIGATINMSGGSTPVFVCLRHRFDSGASAHVFEFGVGLLTDDELTWTVAAATFGTALTNAAATLWNAGSGGGYATPLRIGGSAVDQGSQYFHGDLSGDLLQPRYLPREAFEQLFQAAKADAPVRTLSKNLGVIKRALRGNAVARAIGDSTSAPGDTSVGSLIAARLQTAGLVPRRMASSRRPGLAARDGTYTPTPPTAYGIDTAPGAEYAVADGGPVVTKRGYGFDVFPVSASEPPDNQVLATLADSLSDVMTKEVFPSVSVRVLYPVTDQAGVVDDIKVRVTNTAGTVTSAPIALSGTDAKFAALDIDVPQASTGNIVTRILGTANTQASSKIGLYEALYINSPTVAAPGKSGLWWLDTIAKVGSTAVQHADDTIYPMSEVAAHDAALFDGINTAFTAKVVFPLLTINDANGGLSESVITAALEDIRDRWLAAGYKVCFVQPWVCYLSSGTSNPSRLPIAYWDGVWENCFLPLAGDDVACLSLHQFYRGTPFQYLEGGSALSTFAIHAANAAGALGLTVPIGQVIEAAAVPDDGESFHRRAFKLFYGGNSKWKRSKRRFAWLE